MSTGFDPSTDPGFLAWQARQAADKEAAAANGWVRYWDGWPMCAVCYDFRLAEKGRTRADLHGGLNTETSDHLKDGDKCVKCGAVFPQNSVDQRAGVNTSEAPPR